MEVSLEPPWFVFYSPFLLLFEEIAAVKQELLEEVIVPKERITTGPLV